MKQRIALVCIVILIVGTLSGCEEKKDRISESLFCITQDEPDYAGASYCLDMERSYTAIVLREYIRICKYLEKASTISRKEFVEGVREYDYDIPEMIRILYDKRQFLPEILQAKITALYEIVMEYDKDYLYLLYLEDNLKSLANSYSPGEVWKVIALIDEVEAELKVYKAFYREKTGRDIDVSLQGLSKDRYDLKNDYEYEYVYDDSLTDISIHLSIYLFTSQFYMAREVDTSAGREFEYACILKCVSYIRNEETDE